MLPTFVIFLREGIEASMVVAILLTTLDQLGRRDRFRDVLAGVTAAVAVLLVGAVAAFVLMRSYAGSRVQTILETITYLVAAVVLTYMTFWMRKHARGLSADLRARASAALDGRARWGIGLLAFQSVGREGLETAVFTLAILFASGPRAGGRPADLAGAGAGMAVSLAIAIAIYRAGARIDLRRLFAVVATLLVIFAAALVADAVEGLEQLGWIPRTTQVWDTARTLPEGSALGDLAHVFLGYAARPSVLQVAAWATYLLVTLGALRVRPGPRRAQVA